MCRLCGDDFSKRAMARHVATCAERRAGPGAHPGPGFLLLAEARGGVHWLYVEALADATLAHLDALLRETWLECCDRVSAFDIGPTTFMSWRDEHLTARGAQGLGERLDAVLAPSLAFTHRYDLGSTTELRLRVASAEGAWGPAAARVLAHNNPPDVLCASRGDGSDCVCLHCSRDLCEACVARRGCPREMTFTRRNSPRMGVCAYGGPGA